LSQLNLLTIIIIGIPLQYYLAIYLNLGLIYLLLGFAIGQFLNVFIGFFLVQYLYDWAEIAEICHERMETE